MHQLPTKKEESTCIANEQLHAISKSDSHTTLKQTESEKHFHWGWRVTRNIDTQKLAFPMEGKATQMSTKPLQNANNWKNLTHKLSKITKQKGEKSAHSQ